MSEGEPDSELEQLPHSCGFAYHKLDDDGPMTLQTLKNETWMSDSTLTDALAELEQRGLVEWEWSASDARRRVYEVDG